MLRDFYVNDNISTEDTNAQLESYRDIEDIDEQFDVMFDNVESMTSDMDRLDKSIEQLTELKGLLSKDSDNSTVVDSINQVLKTIDYPTTISSESFSEDDVIKISNDIDMAIEDISEAISKMKAKTINMISNLQKWWKSVVTVSDENIKDIETKLSGATGDIKKTTFREFFLWHVFAWYLLVTGNKKDYLDKDGIPFRSFVNMNKDVTIPLLNTLKGMSKFNILKDKDILSVIKSNQSNVLKNGSLVKKKDAIITALTRIKFYYAYTDEKTGKLKTSSYTYGRNLTIYTMGIRIGFKLKNYAGMRIQTGTLSEVKEIVKQAKSVHNSLKPISATLTNNIEKSFSELTKMYSSGDKEKVNSVEPSFHILRDSGIANMRFLNFMVARSLKMAKQSLANYDHTK